MGVVISFKAKSFILQEVFKLNGTKIGNFWLISASWEKLCNFAEN